ncbi:hypothetical protein KKI24_18275 [bacterium]|nr:hypothetical protein [bacterium]
MPWAFSGARSPVHPVTTLCGISGGCAPLRTARETIDGSALAPGAAVEITVIAHQRKA